MEVCGESQDNALNRKLVPICFCLSLYFFPDYQGSRDDQGTYCQTHSGLCLSVTRTE